MGFRISKSFSVSGTRFTFGHTFFGRRAAPKSPKSTPPLGCSGCLLALASPLIVVLGCGVIVSHFSTPDHKRPQPRPQIQPLVGEQAPLADEPNQVEALELSQEIAETQEFESDPADPSHDQSVTDATLEAIPAETPEPTLGVDPFREWKSRRGTFHIVAALAGLANSEATLVKEDGSETKVAISKLSDEDQEYLKKFEIDLVGKCIGVHDGDSITVLDDDHNQVKVRLEGIDAPESKQDYGSVSRARLAHHVFQKTIRVHRRDKDRYGRTLGYVFNDKLWVNFDMVQHGYAWHYLKYSADKRLASAQTSAQANRVGLWTRPDRVAPWEYRQQPIVVVNPKPRPVAVKPKWQPPVESPQPSYTPSYTPDRSYTPSYSGGSVHVKGYYRKDGTYVRPHTRRK